MCMCVYFLWRPFFFSCQLSLQCEHTLLFSFICFPFIVSVVSANTVAYYFREFLSTLCLILQSLFLVVLHCYRYAYKSSIGVRPVILDYLLSLLFLSFFFSCFSLFSLFIALFVRKVYVYNNHSTFAQNATFVHSTIIIRHLLKTPHLCSLQVHLFPLVRISFFLSPIVCFFPFQLLVCVFQKQ